MVRHGEPYVFVSHSSGDIAESEALVAALASHGVNAWIDRADIVPGTPYALQIVDAVEACSSMVVVLSANANESRGVLNEIELAFNRRRQIYTVRIEDVKPYRGMSFYLSADQWTDGFGPNRDANLARLAEAILAAPGQAGSVVQVPPMRSVSVPATKPVASANSPGHGGLGLMSDVSTPPTATGPVEEERVVRAFIGDMAPHFLASWERMEKARSELSFSFPALLLGPIWFAYRKMYGLAFMNLGVCGLLGFLLFFSDKSGGGSAAVTSFLALAFGVALIVAMLANGFYRKHVLRTIRGYNTARNTVHGIRDRTTVEGGVNVGGAVGMAVAAALMHLMLIGMVEEEFQAKQDPGMFEMPAEAAAEATAAPEDMAADAVDAAK